MRRGTAAALAAVTHVLGILGDVLAVPYAVASSSFASTAFALCLNASDKSCALLLGNTGGDVLASATLIAIAVGRRTMEDVMYHGIGRALGVDALGLSSSSSSQRTTATTTTLVGALLWPTTASCILCGAACTGSASTIPSLATVAVLIAITTCIRVLAFAFVGEALATRLRALFPNRTDSDASSSSPLVILGASSAVFAIVPILFAWYARHRRPVAPASRTTTKMD
jgi:hypothetical protein